MQSWLSCKGGAHYLFTGVAVKLCICTCVLPGIVLAIVTAARWLLEVSGAAAAGTCPKRGMSRPRSGRQTLLLLLLLGAGRMMQLVVLQVWQTQERYLCMVCCC
jgi:Zn-dependent protease with chaperone function